MDLLTLIGKFENSDFNRETVSTNYGNTLSYTPTTDVTITVNSDDEYTDLFRVCILDNGTNIKLYLHYLKEKYGKSYNISAISTLVVS